MAFSNQHLVCVECEESGLSVTVDVIRVINPAIPGCPLGWDDQKPILPATNSSAASAGQGIVNCPYVAGACTEQQAASPCACGIDVYQYCLSMIVVHATRRKEI